MAEHVGPLPSSTARAVGVISKRDITRAAAHEPHLRSVSASQYLSKPFEVATVDADSRDIARLMLNAGIRHLPVVSGYTLIGMVSIRDLLAVESWAA